MVRIHRFLQLIERGVTYVFILLIKAYKLLISSILPASCRYYPSCSSYSIEALRKHGLLKGSYLAGKRILSCNPYCAGGFDPVPEKFCFFKTK